MDVKATAARILGRKADIMTRDSIHKALRARRSGRDAGLRMPVRPVSLRPDDMIEAAEPVRAVRGEVSPDELEAAWRQQELVQSGSGINPESGRHLTAAARRPGEISASLVSVPS